MEMKNANGYSVTEIVEYYIKKYGIKSSEHLDLDDDAKKPMNKKIRRLIKGAMIKVNGNDISLWDMFGEQNQKRLIPIDTFEQHCFVGLADHILSKYYVRNEQQLREDRDKYAYLIDEVSKIVERTNASYGEDPVVSDDDDFMTENEVFARLTGINMEVEVPRMTVEFKQQAVLDALYDLFYEPFDLERLKADLFQSGTVNDICDCDYTVATHLAREHLKDYRNYARRRQEAAEVKKETVYRKAGDPKPKKQ